MAVKITVIGRPGTAVEQDQAVVLALTSEKVPDLPGLGHMTVALSQVP